MRNRTVGSPDATRAVDWEQRIDFPRLRAERLDRAKAALAASSHSRQRLYASICAVLTPPTLNVR